MAKQRPGTKLIVIPGYLCGRRCAYRAVVFDNPEANNRK